MIGLGSTELIVICFVAVFVFLMVVFPYWKIFGKAGFSSWCSVLMVIPGVNIIMLYFLAFSEWPSLKQQKPLDPSSTLNN